MIAFVRGVTAARSRSGSRSNPVRLLRRHGDRHRADEPRLLGIRDPERARHEHLVARIQEGDDHVEERVLGAARDQDVRRLVVEAVVALELAADGGPQLRHAADLGVLRVALPHRLDRRVLDPLGRVEVRLTRAERDHVDAATAQLTGLRLHGERRRWGKRLQAIGQHGVAPSAADRRVTWEGTSRPVASRRSAAPCRRPTCRSWRLP